MHQEDGDGDKKPSSASSLVAHNDDIEAHPEFWRFRWERGDPFPWNAMKQLGWTWHKGRNVYQAPTRPDGSPGREIGESNAVLDYLNSFAIPRVYTNLQWPDDIDNGVDFGSDDDDKGSAANRKEPEIGAALRKAIVEKILQKNGTSWSNDKAYDDDDDDEPVPRHDDDDDDDDGDDSGSTRAATGEVRRSARVASSSTRTVTAVEKGTDLYLRRRTQTVARANKNKKGDASSSSKKGENSTTTPRERLTLQECRDFIESHPMDQVENIEQGYHGQFAKWRFLLSTNHSLLFHGAGSKRVLLNSFAKEELRKEGRSLVIDGTDEDVTMDGILDLLIQVCLDGQEPTDLSAVVRNGNVPVTAKFCPWKAHATVERAIMIGRGLAHHAQEGDRPLPFFLVIHSLDTRLATPLAQEALAALVINSTVANGVASLRLVASADHVDAPTFLWDPFTEANLSWFPCCIHTYRPFVQELSLLEEDHAERKKKERESRTNTQAQRILDVLGNLAPRHTEVVQLLAQLQVQDNEWVEFLQYRERCKRACAIAKDSQLRNLLTELKDHGLVVSKMEGSQEWVQIPFSAEKLQEIIDFERDN